MSGDARDRVRRAWDGVLCALKCVMRMKCVHVGEMVCMCALLVRRAHRERADRGNARVVRAAVRAVTWGALPFLLAMGSW